VNVNAVNNSQHVRYSQREHPKRIM
jgi:hypothetical protein